MQTSSERSCRPSRQFSRTKCALFSRYVIYICIQLLHSFAAVVLVLCRGENMPHARKAYCTNLHTLSVVCDTCVFCCTSLYCPSLTHSEFFHTCNNTHTPHCIYYNRARCCLRTGATKTSTTCPRRPSCAITAATPKSRRPERRLTVCP